MIYEVTIIIRRDTSNRDEKMFYTKFRFPRDWVEQFDYEVLERVMVEEYRSQLPEILGMMKSDAI